MESINEAILRLKNKKFILVCDDQDREDEADLIMAAEFVGPNEVNFMINHGRGLICVPLSKIMAEKLHLNLMVAEHAGTFETAFTISVDYIHGTQTGISSADRAKTIRALSEEQSTPTDFARPGHVFPLIAWDEGVLKRAGHTEAAVDLMKLAGLKSVAVLCETLSPEGDPLKGSELENFSKKWDIPILSIKDLISYQKKRNQIIF